MKRRKNPRRIEISRDEMILQTAHVLSAGCRVEICLIEGDLVCDFHCYKRDAEDCPIHTYKKYHIGCLELEDLLTLEDIEILERLGYEVWDGKE